MRVLVADDQAKVRSAIRLLLEQAADIKVLGEAVDATGLLDWVSVVCPDLVLLDWELPGCDAEELLGAIRGTCSRVKVVAMSGRPHAREEAVAAGADAFVSKGDPPECLLEAVRACAHGGEEPSAKDGARPDPPAEGTQALPDSTPRTEGGQEGSA